MICLLDFVYSLIVDMIAETGEQFLRELKATPRADGTPT